METYLLQVIVKRIANHLSPEETAASLKRAAVAWKGRSELEFQKLERVCMLVAAFEKITRMTFPLGDDNLIFVSLGSDSNTNGTS